MKRLFIHFALSTVFLISSYGNSLIIDPWGSILSRGSSDKEEILIADLDLKQLDIIRNNMPLSLIE